MTAERAPLPIVGRLLEPLYRAAMARRNARFDAGDRVERVGVPVVSVGNLSVGGTGKTPMVRAVVRWLRDAGHTPFIAMRGYGAKPDEMSDEQAEYVAALPGVAVLAAPDRVSAIRDYLHELEHPAATCCVLDDGFQHRFVARELDIVLVDATRDPFEDRCVPAGWLREPVSSLRRAQAVVVTRADMAPAGAADRIGRAARGVAPGAAIAACRHVWTELLDESGAARPLAWLPGRSVGVACSIGNPAPFVEQARRAGCSVVFEQLRRDHARWTAKDGAELLGRAAGARVDAVLVTGKDWATLATAISASRDAGASGPPVIRPRVEIEFLSGEGLLRELVRRAAAGDYGREGGSAPVSSLSPQEGPPGLAARAPHPE